MRNPLWYKKSSYQKFKKLYKFYYPQIIKERRVTVYYFYDTLYNITYSFYFMRRSWATCYYLFQKINLASLIESWSRAGKNELPICTECSVATRTRSSRRNWRTEEPMEQNCLRCTTDEGGVNREGGLGPRPR